MSKRVEIGAPAVVGGIAGVYLTAAADAGGLVIFTAAVLGAVALATLALLGMQGLQRRRRRREQMTKTTMVVAGLVDRLTKLEKAHEDDVAALRTTQRDDRLHAIEMLKDSVHKLGNLLTEMALRTEQTRQLVLPDWLRRAEQWATEQGWTVTQKGCAIEFSRENEPDRTAQIVLPLGSHEQEEATRVALHTHLGYPERRTYLAQLGRMTRVLGRGDA